MNNETYKQAFSALHASDEIKLEHDMVERKTNKSFHMRPAIAVGLCTVALLGCFSTAFALDAGGVRSNILDLAAMDKSGEEVELKAGETYTGETPGGGEFTIETAKDSEYDLSLSSSEDEESMTVTITGKNDTGSESSQVEEKAAEPDNKDSDKDAEKSSGNEAEATSNESKGASENKSSDS